MGVVTSTARGLFAPRTRVAEGTRTVPAWLHVAVLGATALVTAYIARGLWGWTYDDAFIIFRYARNFAGGLGMVYNPGEAYLGTSSIGYTLLLAVMHLALPNLDFLDLGSMVSALGLFATGALIWLMGVQTRSPLAGALAALITIANPVLVEEWGGEMYLLVALVLGAILAYSRGMGAVTGALLGLAVLTRYDSLVLVAAIAAHYLLTRRKVPVSAIVAFAVILLPWTVYSWAFYGSPLPGTLDAKIAQGKAGWTMFFSGTVQWLNDRLGPGAIRVLVLALIPTGALTLLLQWRKKPLGPWFILLAWCALYTVGYTALRVAFYGWYTIPAAVGLGVLIAWGVSGLVELVALAARKALSRLRAEGTVWASAVSYALGAVVLLLLTIPMADHVRRFADNYIASHRESDLYARVGEWLRAQGGPGVSMAYLEVGEVGYYSDSRVIDLLGLVTPGAAAHVPALDYRWAVQRYRPDYYLANQRFSALLQNMEQEAWFIAAYGEVTTFEDHRKNDPNVYKMVVYKRKPGAVLPPPVRPVVVQRISQQPLWISSATAAGHRFGQTFTAPEANVSAIALLLGKSNAATGGNLVLHLRRSPTAKEDLRQVITPLSEVANNQWHTFYFEPIPDSAGQSYFFTVELTGTPPRQPLVVIWIATDDLYPDGKRYEGIVPVAGDFCMRVSVPDER